MIRLLSYLPALVFSIMCSPSTLIAADLSTLYLFSGASDGGYPFDGLLMDSSGKLYGTTATGGDLTMGNGLGLGTVFEYSTTTQQLTTLSTFEGSNGSNPDGNLISDSAGDLYGTTSGGGQYNDGTVFEIAAGTGNINTLASFNGTNGAIPYSGLGGRRCRQSVRNDGKRGIKQPRNRL